MTTPKMLGLPKKSLDNSGGISHTSRRTGLDTQNPYAEVFSRSSTLPKHTSRTPTGKSQSNVFSGVRTSLPRIASKSPTAPGYVTPDPIIPRVNAPSTLGRNNF
ncbi:hypothetical protein GCK32_017763 [Trichostrongylus colubriformis]|uniref:Uncharacterized protein n=1 Tax=Trichostrongylus colubriformis TaxID=6319 RepID=A0AAN8FKL2_TRICO